MGAKRKATLWQQMQVLHCLICRRNALSLEDELHLASFLGKQLHDLHLLPLPHQSSNDSVLMASEVCVQPSQCIGFSVNLTDKIGYPPDLELFISILNRKRKNVASRLAEWYVNLQVTDYGVLSSTDALGCSINFRKVYNGVQL